MNKATIFIIFIFGLWLVTLTTTTNTPQQIGEEILLKVENTIKAVKTTSDLANTYIDTTLKVKNFATQRWEIAKNFHPIYWYTQGGKWAFENITQPIWQRIINLF